MGDATILWLTVAIFSVTYLALAVGKVPGLAMDRSGIAFAGATAMLCTGVITLVQAVAPDSIDYNTLLLLFGMMVVVGFLRLSGLLARLTHWSLDRIRSPRSLLVAVILLAGLLSAFLVNDIVCIALTPIVLHISAKMRYPPVPQLIGLATAANIGSVGTITGNPQNMFIGSHSGIPYSTFFIHLMPVALFGLLMDYFVIVWVYRKCLAPNIGSAGYEIDPYRRESGLSTNDDSEFPQLQTKSVVIALFAVLLFFTGLPIAIVAIGAAAVLMISRVKPDRIYREIDWCLLLMFIGLFIIVRAFQLNVVTRWGIEHWNIILSNPVVALSIASAGLSNLVSNVPAVLLFEPILKAMPNDSQQLAWLALAMSSTLAGNLTVVGSVANLIVVECAKREGVEISFWEYCKAGIPVTLLTLVLGIAWLEWFRF